MVRVTHRPVCAQWPLLAVVRVITLPTTKNAPFARMGAHVRVERHSPIVRCHAMPMNILKTTNVMIAQVGFHIPRVEHMMKPGVIAIVR
jgi:hypothetical protein